MSDISDTTTIVRNLLGDFSRTQAPGDLFTYTGVSSVFRLTEPSATSVSLVKKNSSTLTSGDYSYSSTTQEVTISASLSAGDTIEIQYAYYPNYSDTEIEAYIRAAVAHLSINNYYTFEVDTSDNFYPDITDRERNLVAVVTSILMKPENQSIRLPDMTITVPNSLPTRDLISKAIRIFKHDTHGNFQII